jgi:signal transduction histidine kinase
MEGAQVSPGGPGATVRRRTLREERFTVQILERRIDLGSAVTGETIRNLRRIQSELQRVKKEMERRKFESVVHGLGDGVAVCSPEWALLDINPAGRRLLDIPEPAGVNLLDHIFEHFAVSIDRDRLAVLPAGHAVFDVTRDETDTVQPLFLEVRADLIEGRARSGIDPGAGAGILVMTVRDVTEQRREQAMQRDFLSLISHKLMTPLTIIQGKTGMLKAGVFGPLSDRQTEEAAAVLRQVAELKALFDHLLTFVRASERPTAGQAVSADPVACLQEILDQLPARYPDSRFRIDARFPEEHPVVSIERGNLEAVIWNLVDNAVKFNDKDTVRLAVAVDREADGRVSIRVGDNGIGMPPEELTKIFDRFFQIEKDFTGQVKGFGLGLAFVRMLVEKAGGTVRVESRPGEGSTFKVLLPAGT